MTLRQRIMASPVVAPIAHAFPPPVLRPIAAEDAVIDGPVRRLAADVILGTSVLGIGTTAVAMTSSLIPKDKQATPREVSLIMFGVVIGGMALCSYTQLAAMRPEPKTRPERHYRNAMTAASAIGLVALGTGIGASFCNDRRVIAGLFGTSVALTVACMCASLWARHAADYSEGQQMVKHAPPALTPDIEREAGLEAEDIETTPPLTPILEREFGFVPGVVPITGATPVVGDRGTQAA